MEQIDTEHAPRAVLHVSDATEWLTAVEAVNSGHTEQLDPRYDAPSADFLNFDADWNYASGENTSEFFNEVITIVRTATELGYLNIPLGTELQLNDRRGDDWYDWSLTCNRYGGIVLVSDSKLMMSLGLGMHGAARALHILQEAVSETNQMLTNLLAGSLTLLAETTTDPVILTRLASYTDPHLRATVVANPATPDEGRVLAALRDLN